MWDEPVQDLEQREGLGNIHSLAAVHYQKAAELGHPEAMVVSFVVCALPVLLETAGVPLVSLIKSDWIHLRRFGQTTCCWCCRQNACALVFGNPHICPACMRILVETVVMGSC